jgi:hypothetical protein
MLRRALRDATGPRKGLRLPDEMLKERLTSFGPYVRTTAVTKEAFMPDAIRTLPPNPSLEQQKKLAKELHKAYDAGDDDARTRIRHHLPDKQRITLADAQFVLAREYGFDSWSKLKQHMEPAPEESVAESDREEFKRVVRSGNADAVATLLRHKPSVRALINQPIFSFGGTALTSTAGDNNVALVDVLLEFGADPNRRSDWWAGPFHALYSASGVVADRLIAAGAVPDACAAAHLDRLDLLRSLLDADPARVHERGGDGQMPLHFARSRAVIDLLLERGADVDARDLDHRATAAQWMLEGKRGAGRYELAKYLVERGASADIFLAAALGLTEHLRDMLESNLALLELKTSQGDYAEQPPSSFHIYTWTIGTNLSPLQVAAQFEQPEALALLRAYASPKQKFLDACAQGRAAEANALLRDHPGLLQQLTVEDQRILPDAGWGANAPAVALMLELGFDPAVTGQVGGNVLHCAAWEGSVPCTEAALRYPAARALIDARDPTHGGTPLNWCSHGARNCGNPAADHARVARLLLQAGATPPANLEDLEPELAAIIREFA